MPKADRKQKTFIVRNLIFEPDFNEYDRIIAPLAEKLKALATFNGCDRVMIERTVPGKVKAPLNKAL
jgi:uncharacterized protein YcaQ